MRALLATILLLCAVLGWWLWPSVTAPDGSVAAANTAAASAAVDEVERPATRELAASSAVNPDEALIPQPSPAGLVFVVVDANGSAIPGVPLQIDWHGNRAGETSHGQDYGCCDGGGRFQSSLRTIEEVQGVRATLPNLGKAEVRHTLQPSLNRADTVILVAPEVAELSVRVVDFLGRTVPAARVDCSHVATLLEPGRYPLQVAMQSVYCDDTGRGTFSVPVGLVNVAVVAPSHHADCVWQCQIQPGHNELLLELDHYADWRIVPVTVWIASEVRGTPSYSAEVGLLRPRRPQPNVRAVVPKRRWLYPVEVPRHEPSELVYEFRVPPGDWHLRFTAEGAIPFARWINPDEAAVRVELRPPATDNMFRLHGTVQTVAGKPAANAEIYWHSLSGNASERMATRADDEGRFSCVLPVGDGGWVAAWLGDEAPAIAGPWSGPGRTLELELRLQPPKTILTGLVDAEDNLIAGSLRLTRPAEPHWAAVEEILWPHAPTFVRRLAPGTYELWAIPDRGGWPARRMVESGTTVTLRCGEGLDNHARIAVRLLDATTLQPLPAAECAGRAADDRGELGLAVPPGDHEVECQHPGYATMRVRWPALHVGRHERTIAMLREQTRFVQLIDDQDRAMANAAVRVVDQSRPGEAYWPTSGDTDADGRAELRGLPAGQLRLCILRFDHEHGVLVDTGQEREFELPANAGVTTTAVLRWSAGRPR